jgi:hypothetical protein
MVSPSPTRRALAWTLPVALSVLCSSAANAGDLSPDEAQARDEAWGDILRHEASDTDARPEHGGRIRVLVGYDPLPRLYGAYSGHAEVIVNGKFGFSGRFHVASYGEGSGDGLQDSWTKLTGFGGELGFRYYTRSPNRHVVSPFFGPSVLFGSYTFSKSVTSSVGADTWTSGSTSGFGRVGVAMDFGILIVAPPCFMLALGGGLQYAVGAPDLSVPQPFGLPSVTNLAYGSGVSPRLLATAGWAF